MIALILTAVLQLPLGAQLEREYWDCDFATTITVLGMEESAYCSMIYEKLKKEKFNGSYDDFLNWWKVNKEAEHEKRRSKK